MLITSPYHLITMLQGVPEFSGFHLCEVFQRGRNKILKSENMNELPYIVFLIYIFIQIKVNTIPDVSTLPILILVTLSSTEKQD